MKPKIYWGAIQAGNSTEKDYIYPTTDSQKKKIVLDKVKIFVYGLVIGFFWGLIFGYGWRVMQG